MDNIIIDENNLNFEQICRTCLCESNNIKSIFQSKLEHPLSEMLMLCSNIQVNISNCLVIDK